MPAQSSDPSVPASALSLIEHERGLLLVEDELYNASASLMAGQIDRYKCKLQSAFLSLQMLMKQEVKM